MGGQSDLFIKKKALDASLHCLRWRTTNQRWCDADNMYAPDCRYLSASNLMHCQFPRDGYEDRWDCRYIYKRLGIIMPISTVVTRERLEEQATKLSTNNSPKIESSSPSHLLSPESRVGSSTELQIRTQCSQSNHPQS